MSSSACDLAVLPRANVDNHRISRLLIYRLGSLGDTIVALPVLHLVARAFPNAERMMLTNSPVSGKAADAQRVLGDSGLVHGYKHYAVGLREPSAILRLIKELRAWHPQVLVYLAEVRSASAIYRDAAFFALCGIRRMIGLPLTKRLRSNLPTADGSFEREAQRLARCIAKLGDARLDDSTSWDLHLHHREVGAAQAVLDLWIGRPRFMVATVGTKVSVNDWGSANWKESLKKISLRYPQLGLALIGSLDEREGAEIAASEWRGPKTNLCGRLTPRESAAVIREAIMYAGHDTGPMHVAAAMGIPCVAVFSARNPRGIWFPWGERHRIIYHSVPCAGCGLEVCVVNRKKCIASISQDEVYNAAVTLLDRCFASLKADNGTA